jgi:hypothetical protein
MRNAFFLLMLLALLLSGSAQAQQPTPSIQVKAVGVTNPTGTKTYAAPIKWFEEMEDPVYIYMFGSDPDMGVYAAEFQCTAQVTYLPTGWSTLSCRWTPGYPDIVPNGWQVGLPLAIAQDDLYFPEVQGFSNLAMDCMRPVSFTRPASSPLSTRTDSKWSTWQQRR